MIKKNYFILNYNLIKEKNYVTERMYIIML